MTGVRSFIAVPLPEKIRSELFVSATSLAGRLPDVKWSRKVENLHVTIKFLGKVAEDRLAAVGEALGRAVSGVPRFELEVRGMGAFPSPERATVIWAGVSCEPDRLGQIAVAVEAMAAEIGVGERQRQHPHEERAFRAHVTVGRAKQGVDARATLAPLADRVFGRAAIDEVHLYESQLGRDGSTYVLRSRAALASN